MVVYGLECIYVIYLYILPFINDFVTYFILTFDFILL